MGFYSLYQEPMSRCLLLNASTMYRDKSGWDISLCYITWMALNTFLILGSQTTFVAPWISILNISLIYSFRIFAVFITLLRCDLNCEADMWCAEQIGKCDELPHTELSKYVTWPIMSLLLPVWSSVLILKIWFCQNVSKHVFILEYSYKWLHMATCYLIGRSLAEGYSRKTLYDAHRL